MAADNRVRRGLRVNPQQELCALLMRAVLERVRDLDMVPKGGTALAVTHGLDRHSTELDFNAERPVELRDRIASAARTLEVNLEPARRQDWRRGPPTRLVSSVPPFHLHAILLAG